MKYLKKYNESLDYTNNLTIKGNDSFSSPISSSSLNISVIKKEYNYKVVGDQMSIKFQTNKGGVVINNIDEIENIIEFLMEYKEKMY